MSTAPPTMPDVIASSPQRGRLRFTGRSGALFSRNGLLTVLLFLSILGAPAAWIRVYRWFAKNTLLPDGRHLIFTGRQGFLWIWTLVYAAANLISKRVIGGSAGSIAWIFAILLLAASLTRWFWSHLELPDGSPTQPVATFWAFANWQALAFLSCVTIVGPAWVHARFYRWICEKRSTHGLRFSFDASGLQMLWRTVVFSLFCLLILTLPWAMVWFHRWLIETIEVTRLADDRSPYPMQDPNAQPIA
jgi:uncharacterized membrane protein YjgN (DUF898 family)